MDLERRLSEIDAFFDSISDEEFANMMIECGAERILPTETIRKNQKMETYNPNFSKNINRNNSTILGYVDYNDGVKRSEAA